MLQLNRAEFLQTIRHHDRNKMSRAEIRQKFYHRRKCLLAHRLI